MKVTLPMISALAAASAAEARYHAAGRNVVAPRQYQFHRGGDWVDLVHHMLRTPPTELIAKNILKQELNTNWNGPSYAISRDDDAGVIGLTMELPGVKASDLDVTLEDNKMLRIQGSRRPLAGDGSVVEFDQSFQLDEDVDPETLKVTLNNGILEIVANKKKKHVTRLEIQTAAVEDSAAIDSIEAKEEVQDSDEVENI